MKIKNDDIQIIAIPTEEYKDLIRENEKIRHELKLLRTLIEYASNNNKGEKKMKYRKKQVVIESFRFYIDPMPDWFMDKVSTNEVTLHKCNHNQYGIKEAYCEIKTLGVIMIANGGDYIVRGVQGEIYPCKPD